LTIRDCCRFAELVRLQIVKMLADSFCRRFVNDDDICLGAAVDWQLAVSGGVGVPDTPSASTFAPPPKADMTAGIIDVG
jgi:hypothetical protein